MDDLLKRIRNLVLRYQEDPHHVPDIRTKINDASRDIILLEEILSYLFESLQNMTMPDRPTGVVEGHLFDSLDVQQQLHDVKLRATDLEKLIHGASAELSNLQQMTDVINTKLLEDVFKNVEANTKYLVDASAANERASASLEVMQIILAGGFAFDIVDRLSGGTLNIAVPDWVNQYLVDPIISVPMFWFFLNMGWLLGISLLLMRLMAFLGEQANGALTLRVKLNKKCDLEKLQKLLLTKIVEVTDAVSEPSGDLKKATWRELDSYKWGGTPPKIEVQWNETFGFLLGVTFSVNVRKTELSEEDFLPRFIADMRAAEILSREDAYDLIKDEKIEKEMRRIEDDRAAILKERDIKQAEEAAQKAKDDKRKIEYEEEHAREMARLVRRESMST